MAHTNNSDGLDHTSTISIRGGKGAGKKQPMPKKNDITKKDMEAIRRRLVVIRTLAAGDNIAQFARLLRVERSRWANMELGYPLTLRMAFLIMKTVSGITIDYITEGSYDRLTPGMKSRIEEVELELFPPPKTRNKTPPE